MTFMRRMCLSLFLLASFENVHAVDFPIVTQTTKVSIVYDASGSPLDSIAAFLLANDINRVTGYLPTVLRDISKVKGNVILIGTLQSESIRKVLGRESALYKSLAGKWECYGLKVIINPVERIDKMLVIAGSDKRGMAYGVFSLSEKIGVNAWYWWADVAIKKKTILSIDQADYVSVSPSVKFRGIFINDEDWGLQPWAAKTFEPETGDIGPKTYEKVFELLLRLKANMIWPAMHPSTKAFYFYPGNKEMAAAYAIVIGSSHAEPMLRNNVGEWNKSLGDFNYITNKEKVYQYWEDRVKESSVNEAIYTIGMRGIHDSGIEGVKDVKEAVPLLERIISDQRTLLEKYNNKGANLIPQVFTAYKEVLDIYDNDLRLPDDVTLVWPDDNYGYIQRLNGPKENKRAGGSGIYYHASYWGRPHDYLWLSSTHPSLIREEMMKAYTNGSNNLWVLNVGDIKPLEYNIQLFMDMAFSAKPFKESAYTKKHLQQWVANVFGANRSLEISAMLWKYYNLAFERRPEFMGWSQTEPTTQTNYTGYNHFYYGDEAQQRIGKYESLENEVKKMTPLISPDLADAFYQLVYYPLVSASWINKKFLYRDKSYLYSRQHRLSAFDYARMAKQVYDSIVIETNYYNNILANGKWKHIMSMRPRELPVYKEPVLPVIKNAKVQGLGIAPEGYDSSATQGIMSKSQVMSLPVFSEGANQKFFIDIFLTDSANVTWKAKTSASWLVLSHTDGILEATKYKNQLRLWVSIDWNRAPQNGNLTAQIIFDAEGNTKIIQVKASRLPQLMQGYKGFVENNGYISIFGKHYNKIENKSTAKWMELHGPGHTGVSLVSETQVEHPMKEIDTAAISKGSATISYHFYNLTETVPQLHFYTLPTHPVNKNVSMRYGFRVDDGMLHIIDFKTVGRSEEWKQNVLRNNAIRQVSLPLLKAGKHRLKIYTIDPRVIVDRIVIDLGGMKSSYGVIPETYYPAIK